MARSERASGGMPGRRGRARRTERRPRPRPTKVERHGRSDPPEGIGGIVRELLQDRRLRRGMALGRLSRSWPQVVGEDLARHTAPRALEGGALVVVASSAAWGSQVRFLAREIARRTNEVLGSEEVRTVTVTVGSLSRKPLGPKGSGSPKGEVEGPGRGAPG